MGYVPSNSLLKNIMSIWFGVFTSFIFSYFQRLACAMEITHYPDIPSGLMNQRGTQYDKRETLG